MIDYDETSRRLDLIRDIISGIGYHLPNPEVLLYPFLDCIMLLHQRELVPAIWKDDRCMDVFLKDPSLLREFEGTHREKMSQYCDGLTRNTVKKHRIALGKTRYSLSIHLFPNLDEIRNGTGSAVTEVDTAATDLTRSLLQGETDPRPFEDFFHSLQIAADRHIERIGRSFSPTSIKREEVAENEVSYFLAPLREILDDVFADYDPVAHDGVPSSLVVKKGDLVYPNVFAVVRTFTGQPGRHEGCFDYTARIILPSRIKKLLETWCGQGCGFSGQHSCPWGLASGEQCVAALERPLGHGARSVADLVFSNGIMAFGMKPSQPSLDQRVNNEGISCREDSDDDARRWVESCIYPENTSLMYPPIHVAGTPWLALYTHCSDEITPETWRHNYWFYRDTVQKGSSLIRLKSQAAYLKLLADQLIKQLKSTSFGSQKHLLIHEINRALTKLAQIYPFPLAQFYAGPAAGTAAISVPGRYDIHLSVAPNPFFPMQVDWGMTSPETIISYCIDRIHAFGEERKYIGLSSFAKVSHLFKNPLAVLSILAKESGNDAVISQAERIRYLHDSAAMLLSESKRDAARKKRLVRMLDAFMGDLGELYTKCRADISLNPDLTAGRANALLPEKVWLEEFPTESCMPTIVSFLPLLMMVIDGILTNAVTSSPNEDPVSVKIRWDGESLWLVVKNRFDNRAGNIEQIIHRLNEPGIDLVGVTNLHWAAEAYWPDRPNRLRWRSEICTGITHVIAEALIAVRDKEAACEDDHGD